MDFFNPSKGKKDGKKTGLFGKKSESKKSTTESPSDSTGGGNRSPMRSPPPSYLSKKKAETEYDFPVVSDEQRPYYKQPMSERVPNSHTRPPVYGYGTPDHRRGQGKERVSYEPETNTGNRTPERRRKSSEYSREREYQQDRMYEADTRSNASPFHPFKSPSPSPYQTPDRRRDQYEPMYEPEVNTIFQKSAPTSPFHPSAGNRSPRQYRTPNRKEQFEEELYERDGDVTPRKSSPPSPFHPAASRSPPPQQYRMPDRRTNHGKEQFEELYEGDGDVTPRNNSPPSPFHPSARRSPPPQHYITPDRRSKHGKEQIEDLYEEDGDSSPPSPFHSAARRSPPPPPQPQPQPHRAPDRRRNHYGNEQFEELMYEPQAGLAPLSPVHRGIQQYYSSSDDDNYMFPEISTPPRTPPRSMPTSSPIHHRYQIVAAETYEQDRQFEPPELPDESQGFSIPEIAKMRGLKSYETTGKEIEEVQSTISDALVSVSNYKVKQSVSETLKAILDKHGDIAASSKLQSIQNRSYYLESLATVVKELKSKMLRDLTKTRVAEIAAVVKDMESVKIDVSWLKKPVTELAEAVEYFGQYDAAKVEREVCEKDLKTVNEEMEKMTVELGKREKDIRECREKVTVVAGKLGQLEMKGSRLKKNLEMFQSKVEKFEGEAVLLHV